MLSNKNLREKIKSVLKDYFKTQFILIIISISLVWFILFLIPEIKPIYEILIATGSYFILSIVMDYFVSPLVIGRTTKVRPLLLVLAFIIGVSFLGVLGAFLAVPIALVIKTIYDHQNS